jgi:hypothetical protein
MFNIFFGGSEANGMICKDIVTTPESYTEALLSGLFGTREAATFDPESKVIWMPEGETAADPADDDTTATPGMWAVNVHYCRQAYDAAKFASATPYCCMGTQ